MYWKSERQILLSIDENMNHDTKSDSNQLDVEYQLYVQPFVRMCYTFLLIAVRFNCHLYSLRKSLVTIDKHIKTKNGWNAQLVGYVIAWINSIAVVKQRT